MGRGLGDNVRRDVLFHRPGSGRRRQPPAADVRILLGAEHILRLGLPQLGAAAAVAAAGAAAVAAVAAVAAIAAANAPAVAAAAVAAANAAAVNAAAAVAANAAANAAAVAAAAVAAAVAAAAVGFVSVLLGEDVVSSLLQLRIHTIWHGVSRSHC